MSSRSQTFKEASFLSITTVFVKKNRYQFAVYGKCSTLDMYVHKSTASP